MTDLPDIEEITLSVEAIERRDPATTPVDRSGSDDEALRRMQVEIDNVLGQQTPSGYPGQDELRALLGRINDAIEKVEARRP